MLKLLEDISVIRWFIFSGSNFDMETKVLKPFTEAKRFYWDEPEMLILSS